MAATFDVESTLTDRYQTTVPETVRRALGLKNVTRSITRFAPTVG
ncbi:type II toxin-antitoxin system PrlF family antitoxin [Pseudomonas putida]